MYLKTMSGETVKVDVCGAPYRPATFHHPAEGGLEELTHVWYEGVDILPLLRDDEYEYLMEQAEKYEADDD
jgi:hypothetical protein